MTKLVGTILKLINLLFVLIYLLSCLIPFLPAGRFWMIAVLGLVFPIICIIVTIFFVGWLFARSRWCLLSFVALALSWQQISVVTGFNNQKEFNLSKPTGTLRLLSWNVSSWGESTKNLNSKFEYRPLMFELIKKQQADVLCFQEFWDLRNSKDTYSSINAIKAFGYPYTYFVKSGIVNDGDKMGVAIFSKYPISDTTKFTYGKDDNAEKLVYTDIQFNQQKIRIFTTHLESVRFEHEEYSAIDKIKSSDKSGLKDSKTIVRKLKNAYQFRGAQADFVQQKIKESPYPVVICGDFNDVPNSYTYFTIRGDLQDAFLKKGSGIGRTFQYLSPTLRIDFILAGRSFDVTQFNRIRYPYSDHYPIIADFTLNSIKN